MKCSSIVAQLVVIILAFGTPKVSCCPVSWSRFGDHCYRIYTGSEEVKSIASLRCHFEGSALVSITNSEILDYLAQHVAHTGDSKFWVGLRMRLNHDGRIVLNWYDGTTSAANESWVKIPDPEEHSHDVFDMLGAGCFVYDGALVVKEPCFRTHPFICGHHVSNVDARRRSRSCEWTSVTAFAPIQYSFLGDSSGNCLFSIPVGVTKQEAENSCAARHATFVDLDDLIKEGLTAFYEHKVLANDGSQYWTNFRWNGTNLLHRDSTPVSDEYPVPVIKDSGECVTVQFNFTDILLTKLYQKNCTNEAFVVCSLPTHGTSTPSSTTEHSTDDFETGVLSDQPEMSCPNGYNWKTDRTKDYCYWETSFETDQLSRNDAEMYCQGYGGHLGSFHSAVEEKIGLSFQYGSLAHDYWIGLFYDAETDTYKWSDGSPLNYTNWAPGHPDHKDKRLRCVAMQAQEKHWVSSLCGILSWFICKVPKKVQHPVPALPTPAPLEPCEKGPFKEKKSAWYFKGACYYPIVESLSWHRAKQYCENVGSTLVSIHSVDEIGFLLRLLHDSVMETNRVWIGLNSFGSDGNFQWTDWTGVDFTYFASNEPNSYQNQEKCCNMNSRTGEWNDENCNAALGFVCKRINDTSVMTTYIPSTEDPRIGNCKKGWITHTDRCYYIGGRREKDRVNWTEAIDICRHHGGYLTSIRDYKDQTFLSYLLQTLGDDAWIGLHDTIQSGRYYWLDNSEVLFTNWAPGEPSFFGIMEDCVKLVVDHLDSGVWKDDECHKKLGYICHTAKDPQLPPPPSERGVNCVHPEGWLKLDNMCFKMFEGTSLTWTDAELACMKDGGHLVSVSDQKVKAVVSYIASEVNQPFFIGLKYDKSSQTVKWMNNFPVTLSNWEKNEPSGMTEDTCFASTSEGYWKKAPCEEEMPYVCQITTGKPTKMKKYTGDCPPSSNLWNPGSGSFCYILDSVFRSDWFTAILMCFRFGSHLVSIHSMDEVEDLKKLIKPDIRSVYIGLMKNKKGGFTWTDDSPVDFENWDEEQPTNSEDQCVEMVTDTMKWRVASCTGKKHYACQDTKGTLVIEDSQAAEFMAEQQGLSTAGICAVVLSILIGFVLLLAAVLYRKKFNKGPQFRRHERNQSVSFENALYSVGNASMEFNEQDKS